MTVSPLPLRGGVHADLRDAGRAVRISAHPESALVTLSVWRHDVCIATHQMAPGDVAKLIGSLGDALAACAPGVPAPR